MPGQVVGRARLLGQIDEPILRLAPPVGDGRGGGGLEGVREVLLEWVCPGREGSSLLLHTAAHDTARGTKQTLSWRQRTAAAGSILCTVYIGGLCRWNMFAEQKVGCWTENWWERTVCYLCPRQVETISLCFSEEEGEEGVRVKPGSTVRSEPTFALAYTNYNTSILTQPHSNSIILFIIINKINNIQTFCFVRILFDNYYIAQRRWKYNRVWHLRKHIQLMRHVNIIYIHNILLIFTSVRNINLCNNMLHIYIVYCILYIVHCILGVRRVCHYFSCIHT